MQYELYAIRYATANQRLRRDNFMPPVPDAHDAPMPMDFFVWLAVGENRNILIDSGATATTCAARGNDFLVCPADAAMTLGVDPVDIDTVVLTHFHWDHAGNIRKFPNARFHAQFAEMVHAVGPSMCNPFLRRPYEVEQTCDIVRLIYSGRLEFHDGGFEVAPGMIVHHIGGHSPGLQIVEVPTRRGNVILASDAAHFFDNVLHMQPFPVLVDMCAYIDGLTRVQRLAGSIDLLVPGHDPSVMTAYPPVSADLGCPAVRLDVCPSFA